jgi:3-oxoacyl-[acyl-carrier protein] reductase
LFLYICLVFIEFISPSKQQAINIKCRSLLEQKKDKNMDLSNKKVLITGGSSGLGKAMAKLLIEEGAKVAITGRDEKKLKQVAEELGAHAIHADVSQEKDVKHSFDVMQNKMGGLDVLINYAGIGSDRKPVDEIDIDEMRKVFEVNVFGLAMMCKMAAKIFKKQKHGNMVNIASTSALKGYEGGSVYSASKFAVRGLSQNWQADLRKYNVRVFNINPSYVPTAFNNPSREERDEKDNLLTAEEIAHAVVSALKMDERGYIPELTVHATNPF